MNRIIILLFRSAIVVSHVAKNMTKILIGGCDYWLGLGKRDRIEPLPERWTGECNRRQLGKKEKQRKKET